MYDAAMLSRRAFLATPFVLAARALPAQRTTTLAVTGTKTYTLAAGALAGTKTSWKLERIVLVAKAPAGGTVIDFGMPALQRTLASDGIRWL